MQRRDGRLIVSATDLVGFLECGHLTLLDRALVAGLVAKPDRGEDPGLELLRWRGGMHEERYIAQLRARGLEVTDLKHTKDLSYAEQAAATEAAMRAGKDVIYQGTVFDGRWVGHPDFLLRVEGSPTSASRLDRSGIDETDSTAGSDVGGLGTDWHYEVADTKLAHVAKASALIQIASYVEQIARIQGVVPEKVYVVTGGAEATTRPFRTADMMAYYRRAKQRFEEALDEAKVGPAQYPIPRARSYPDPVEHCGVCRWSYSECRRVWHADDALPIVAGISRKQRDELRTLGIETRRGLAASDVHGFDTVKEQARLQAESEDAGALKWELLEGSKEVNRGLSALPEPSAFDLFFDFEGDPFAFWEGLEYLFGIWDGAAYMPYWALTRAGEKQQFETVMDWFHSRWREHPEMHVYHYGAYEPSRLRTLAGRHATRQDELDELLTAEIFVDLYRVVKQGVRVGSERYSIKNLEPLYGFTRTIELRDAGSSIAEFERLLEVGDPGGELKALIEGYNGDDCVSTEKLRDWLEERRLDAARQFGGELPRPVLKTAAPAEEPSDRVRAVRELEARLTASATDETTHLLANLLEWHRREDKSTWWRYYDLMGKSDDELLDEPAAIAQLELIDMYELGGKSRSNVWRYRFPPQELKVDLGYADDPQLGHHKATGEIVALDEDAGIVEIRRGRSWDGPHPRSIVQVTVIDAKEQKKALLRIGEWVAENGIGSDLPDYRSARDLLRKRAPRAGQPTDSPLSQPSESGSQAALRLATQLDGTTLAIQGPPGSGKTYTGARMILELVRAGKKVGITSNSHKVIGNLVEAVLEAGSARVIQKAGTDEAYDHPSVTQTDDNAEVVSALATGSADVAAGTPWLWSREDMLGSVDTLFVDEAGQVSLANVVAVSGAARNVVLLGDPQQLDQPTQGVHPDGAGVSALTHFLDDEQTVPPARGLFLRETYRMHPEITRYTSDLFYEGKLDSVAGLERQAILGSDWLSGSGLRWVPVEHDDNTNESPEEAAKVAEIWNALVGREWIDKDGARRLMGPRDIVVITPFNAHRLRISRLLGSSARVGTVDKFQGQEAAVSIYTMATSRPEDAPRGMDFLFSLHRLNVATSRAKALAIVVCSTPLLDALAHSPDQLRMVNGQCAFVEAARP